MGLDCLNRVHQLIDIFLFPRDAGPEHSDEVEPDLTLSLPVTHICVNFSTVYNDTLVAKGLNRLLFGSHD